MFHNLVKVSHDLETSFDPKTRVAFCPRDFFITQNLDQRTFQTGSKSKSRWGNITPKITNSPLSENFYTEGSSERPSES